MSTCIDMRVPLKYPNGYLTGMNHNLIANMNSDSDDEYQTSAAATTDDDDDYHRRRRAAGKLRARPPQLDRYAAKSQLNPNESK